LQVKHISGYDYRIISAISEIKKLGIQGQRSHEKEIPEQYLKADRESRLELLKGLMDTDGYQSDRNYAEYCTTSKNFLNKLPIFVEV
jgi:hypothetical protein